MKRILITGIDSFIGNAAENYLKPFGYDITVLDMRDAAWTEFDFSNFDTILHVAGIAHDTSNNTNEELYYKINYELAKQTADKAKKEGVKQFIFISSMVIYNKSKAKTITIDTQPKAGSSYGSSKLMADEYMQSLSDGSFKTAVLRLPMVFGKNNKGNFIRLVKLSQKLRIFPKIKNQRSMIHIDNLCEFFRLVIENESEGVFFPQNREYHCTSDIALAARKKIGKKLHLTILFNWIIKLFMGAVPQLNKMFGDFKYDKELSANFDWSYIVKDNESSIEDSL